MTNIDMHLLNRPLRAGLIVLGMGVLLPFPMQAHAAAGRLLRYHWVVGLQVRQTETGSSTVVTHLTPDVGLNGTEVATYHITATQTVRKVYPDGSGLVRSTFADVSTTHDGKKTVYALKDYALDQRISTRGAILSHKVMGAYSKLDDLPSDVTDPTPVLYPAAAVRVGSTWHELLSTNGVSLIGADTGAGFVITVQVLAFSSMGGHPTVTLGLSLHQRLYGVAGPISGLITGSGTIPLVVTSGAPAAAQHIVFSFRGTIAGPISGKQAHGTVDATVDEAVNPVP